MGFSLAITAEDDADAKRRFNALADGGQVQMPLGKALVEARDLNEAIQLAAKIPPASVGSIEVRPIRPIRDSGS